MDHTLDFLREQHVDAGLIQEAEVFRNRYPVETEEKNRVSQPDMPFYGREVLEMGIAAILQGENLLLTGAKATGKNILAENLAWIFGRPVYNVSFHVNTNSGDLIGTDTFVDNQVQLRKGSIYRCAQYGGFGILDEINMAKNDAVSVLHAALDYRRCIDASFPRICRLFGRRHDGLSFGGRLLAASLRGGELANEYGDIGRQSLSPLVGTGHSRIFQNRIPCFP